MLAYLAYFLHIFAYFHIGGIVMGHCILIAYFVHIFAYFLLHIFAYLSDCIYLHINTYNVYNAYNVYSVIEYFKFKYV